MMKSKPSTVGNEKQQNIIRWNDDTSAFYPSPQCMGYYCPHFQKFLCNEFSKSFPKNYFKKCTSLSHFKNSHKYQISHFYQLWNFKIGFQFHIINISKYKDSSAIYLKYDGNIIIQNNIPPTHRALPIIHCNCTYV